MGRESYEHYISSLWDVPNQHKSYWSPSSLIWTEFDDIVYVAFKNFSTMCCMASILQLPECYILLCLPLQFKVIDILSNCNILS